MAKARDARVLRSLLELAPPRGVTRTAWRRYLTTQVRPRVEVVLADLGQPVDGPAAKPEDLTPPEPRAKPTRTRSEAADDAPARASFVGPVLDSDALDVHAYGGGAHRGPCLQLLVKDPRGVTTLDYDETVELRDALTDWISRVDNAHAPQEAA